MRRRDGWIAIGLLLLGGVAIAQEPAPGAQRAPARLGISLASGDGVPTVTEVGTGTTAAAIGLLPGDVIEAIDGVEVGGSEALVARVRSRFEGDEVVVRVSRGGEVLELRGAYIAPPPLPMSVGRDAPEWGDARWGNLPEGSGAPTARSLRGKAVVLFCFQSW